MNCVYRLPLSLLALICSAVFCAAETALPDPQPWPLENVELQLSPQITWGRLESGLRYAIMPHASPPDRISMHLLVTAGSLNENDNERGYAHFVEHMAFNGTKHFPSGELVKFLQRQGATFGPHINAVTSRSRTLYKLDLPDNSSSTLETGLRIFRDFADGILFAPGEIKSERGVILSEERALHTIEEARRTALTDLLYRGTRIPDRPPIGLTRQIEQADAMGLRNFYDAWYRPENMCVIVVGHVDTIRAEELVRKEFQSLAARGPARKLPSLGQLPLFTEPVIMPHVQPYTGLAISVFKIKPRVVPPPTWGAQFTGLTLHSAFNMLARRLHLLTQLEQPVIVGPETSIDAEYGSFRKLMVKVSSAPANWEKALAIAEQEVRRIIEHGFSADEVDYQKNLLRNAARASAAGVATAPSSELINIIADSMQEGSPLTLADDALENRLATINRLSAEDCQRIFREYWGDDAPHIFITTAAGFMPSSEKILTAYATSRKVAVESAKAPERTLFAYEDFGQAGEVAEKKHVLDLDFWTVRFTNGVRLNVKRTPFENGLVRFTVRLGTGALGEPTDKPGLRLWTGAWWLGGTGKHSVGELSRIPDGLASSNVTDGNDAFVLSGSARTAHFGRAIRQLASFVSDPAFRPEGFRSMASSLHGQLDPLWNQPEGPVQRFVLPSLAGKDPRIGVPDPATIFARTPEEFRAWIEPQLQKGAIEIALVGDIEVELAIAEVAKTFGTFPLREPKPALQNERQLKFPSKPAYNYYFYAGTADRPTVLEFFWPVRTSLKAADRRRLPMLALILGGRVAEQVREKKGATYAPNVRFFELDSYPGLAAIRCTLEVKPGDAKKYGTVVRELADKLAQKGITSDELERAKAQFAATSKSWKTDNNFWLRNVITAAQEHPEEVDDARSAESDIAQTSIADLNLLASHYLRTDQVSRYIIEPSARMPKQKP